MCDYKCPKCSKSFRDNWKVNRHLNRKTSCMPENEGDFNLVSDKYQTSINSVSNKYQTSINLVSKNIQPDSDKLINSTNYNNSQTTPTTYACSYCNKEFGYSGNYYRHMKHTCKKKRECLEENNKHKEENKELNDIRKLELDARKKELEYKINKTTVNNNNITNNNNNNSNNNIQVNNNYININPLGQEDISFLTQETMLSLINERYNAFNAIQRALGNNPSNINYFQKDNKHIKYVNEEHQLVHGHLKDIMNQQVCYGIDKIIDMYELVKDKLTRKQRKHYEKMINESLNGDINKKYSEELGLIMLDNRDTNKKFLESDKPLTVAINASIPSTSDGEEQATVAIDASIL